MSSLINNLLEIGLSEEEKALFEDYKKLRTKSRARYNVRFNAENVRFLLEAMEKAEAEVLKNLP